jgi:IS4 transposase
MRSGRNNSGLCARQASDMAAGILQGSLKLVDHGPKCTVSNVLLVLFFAAARLGSICDACLRLARAPTDQAVRNALNAMLPRTMPSLERRLNEALAERVPRGLLKKARPLAIDVHDEPYYGQPHEYKKELRRGKRQKGTSRFHSYATLCVLHRGRRYTLAATYVWKGDTAERIVRRLLARAWQMGVRVRYLLLDRAFYNVGVVQYLQSARCPFLMPVVHRGRKPKPKPKQKPKQKLGKPGQPTGTGTRRFLAWRRGGFGEHVMRRGKGKDPKDQVTVKIAVCRTGPRRARKAKKANGKAGRPQGRGRGKPLVFAFWGFRPASPAWCRQRYRRRFGIEASYRQANQGRVRTCCRDPRIRLLLFVLALLLRNLWVWLHERVLGTRRGGGVQLRLHLLRFRTLLLLLARCAEEAFGCSETASTPISLSSRCLGACTATG